MKNDIQLGLKENWLQFSFLVLINAFVGGMIGIERSILPQFAESKFNIASHTFTFSFIIAFGITKAITNYFTGLLSNKYGRKNILILGWLFAIPIPFIFLYAHNWTWIIMANILLGINQGLAWTSTILMKIDLVGEKNRGLAMGLNEFAGYVSVGLFAYLSSYFAHQFDATNTLFYLSIILMTLGLLCSIFLIHNTNAHIALENKINTKEKLNNIFLETTIVNKNLSAITQAGFVNNLNDGMMWGLLPVLLFSANINAQMIGIITAVYPTFWGFTQLITGKMSDIYSKKMMLFWGMFLQGLAIICFIWAVSSTEFIILAAILGIGTAAVYPTFLSAIAAESNPMQRAETMGVFRFWRDLGYAIGAMTTGIIADIFGINAAILLIGFITIFSAFVISVRYKSAEKIVNH